MRSPYTPYDKDDKRRNPYGPFGNPYDWFPSSDPVTDEIMKEMKRNNIDNIPVIVGGIIPLALGVALALKIKGSNRRVWCFVGDMTSETGVFHECYKYALNFKLPILI